MDQIFKDLVVVKRSGQRVSFNGTKIAIAIKKAFDEVYETYDENVVNYVYNLVIKNIISEYQNRKTINVEDIQDIIENNLKKQNILDVYEAFNKYRQRRKASRETFLDKEEHKFVKVIEDINSNYKESLDDKTIKGLIECGKTINKEYARSYLIDNKYVRSHDDGTLFIPNLNTYASGTIDSYHIDLTSIDSDNLYSYTNKIKDILINIKIDVNNYINIPMINRLYKKIYLNHFKNELIKNINNYLTYEGLIDYINIKKIEETVNKIDSINISSQLFESFINNQKVEYLFKKSISEAIKNADELLKICLLDLFKSLNNIKVFLKTGNYSLSVLYNEDYEENKILNTIVDILDENDFFENIAVIFKVENKNIFEDITRIIDKNIYILNSKNNIEYLPTGEKVYENFWSEPTSLGKSINCKTIINLPRIGIISSSKDEYFNNLTNVMEMAKNQLLQNFEYIASKTKNHFEYLFNTDIFTNLELDENQKIRKIIKNGSLEIQFLGLYESVIAFKKVYDIKFAEEVIKHMNKLCKEFTETEKLNFSLNASSDIKVSRKLMQIDKSVYGSILNVTDKKSYNLGFISLDLDITQINKFDSYLCGGSVYQMKMSPKTSDKKIIETINEILKSDISFIKISEINRDDL